VDFWDGLLNPYGDRYMDAHVHLIVIDAYDIVAASPFSLHTHERG
jgi:hypothetical protein